MPSGTKPKLPRAVCNKQACFGNTNLDQLFCLGMRPLWAGFSRPTQVPMTLPGLT